MKSLIFIILAVCCAVVASMNQKCCIVAPSCDHDDAMNIINEKKCPVAPCCQGENAELIRSAGNCCCDSEVMGGGPRKRPYLGLTQQYDAEPTELPVCVVDADSNVTDGFLEVCSESSICPESTTLVLENLEDVSSIGKCCCAPPKIAGVLHFISI